VAGFTAAAIIATPKKDSSDSDSASWSDGTFFAEMCISSEKGSYFRLVYHSTLGLRVKKKKKKRDGTSEVDAQVHPAPPPHAHCET